ncbi:FixH family protein [Aegicerativicinus sediminis]|uniref:FixH family protein n=1 Tax=Aegicerativicinus sediminis TaxID=2893202 RepID=UPI001E4096C3|nr:FixH family protein [Aegicerativicinus sediminis]
MKINWGTGIVIGMALFMSFILYFVFKAANQNANETDLVTEEYYKKEQNLQADIYAMENVMNMKNPVVVSKINSGLAIIFPDDFESEGIKGTIYLYRPSNKNLDLEIPLALENAQDLIPADNLLPGRWDISIRWSYGGKDYLMKKSLTL